MDGRVARLTGIDGARKMSKSFDNAIYLSDPPDAIRAKVARIYTGRQSITEPGDPDNALFQLARAFIPDAEHVRALADRYARGDSIGDAAIKAELATAIEAFLAPMRERRAAYDGARGEALLVELLHEHARRANAVANETLALARDAMRFSP